MSKSLNDMTGKSWDEVIQEIASPDDEEDVTLFGRTINVGNSDSSYFLVDLDQQCRIPESLSYLFRRYPVDDSYSVTKCNYCERILSTTFMEKHVEECEKIPQVVKDELHVLTYGTKPKSGSSVKKSSTSTSAGIKTRLPISATTTRPAKQSSPLPTELHLQQAKSSHSTPLSSRSCSSAPPSPTGSSSNTPLLVTATTVVPQNTNYSFPTIKIEKSDSPGPVKPIPQAIPPTSLKLKKTQLVPQPPPSLKMKQSVVLKIKGNTSTTTTSAAGRMTLHAAPSEPPSPSSSAFGDVHQNVGSPKVALPESVVHNVSQGSQGLDESFLPSVVASLGLAQPKVSIKPLDINEVPVIKKKRSRHDARKVIPLRERSFNPNEHCGVIGPDGVQCKRSLTCKTHSMGLRRAVPGRSQPFDILISSQKQARDKAKLAKQDSSAPTSPLVGLSPLVGCSVSSGDGSSDASRLSIPVPTPPAGINTITNTYPRSSPAPTSTITLQSLLNSGIQYAEATGPPFTASVKSDAKITTMPMMSPKVSAPPLLLTIKKKVKKLRDSSETGIKLQSVPKEPEGFDIVTHIIPPDEEGMEPSKDSTLLDTLPIVNGKNILISEETMGHLLYDSIQMIPIPVGRRKKHKFRRSGSSSHFVENLPTKKPRREMDSSTDMILHGNWIQDPASETLTLTRGDDGEGSEFDGILQPLSHILPSPRLQPIKLSFWLQAKEICRPHHAGRIQEGRVHVGPLAEMKQAQNGLPVTIVDYGTGSQHLTSFESMEIGGDSKGGGEPTSSHPIAQQLQLSSKAYEGNGRNWMTAEPNRTVDAPVADSELSKLLAAQFEDY